METELREIRSCILQWTTKVEEALCSGDMVQFHVVKERLNTLLEMRRRVMIAAASSDPDQEAAMQLEIKELIASSRRSDEGYMVPRNESGVVMDFNKEGIVEIVRAHRELRKAALKQENSSLWQDKVDIRRAESAMIAVKAKLRKSAARGTVVNIEGVDTYPDGNMQLYLHIKATMFSFGEPTEVYCGLYSDHLKKYITEEYVLTLTDKGMPIPLSLMDHMKCVFADLNDDDFDHELYLVCKIFRLGALQDEKKKKKSSKEATYRRPVGCAVMELKKLMLQTKLGVEELPSANAMAIYTHKDESKISRLHEIIIKDGDENAPSTGNPLGIEGLIKPRTATGLAIGLVLYSGELKDLVAASERADDKMLSLAAPAKKLKFSKVIDPSLDRNDMYITVKSASLTRGSKRQEKNAELRIRIMTDKGQTVEECMYRGCGPMAKPLSLYKSCVYRHTNSPSFNECLRLNIPSSIFERCHVFVALWHVSGKSGKSKCDSFAYLPLTCNGGAVIPDRPNKLRGYKPFPKVDAPTNTAYYLKGEQKAQPELVYVKEEVVINTQLCSTKKTQNGTLHALFNWKSIPTPDLEKALKDYRKVEGSELLRFLRETFDVLFTMLDSGPSSEVSKGVFLFLLYIFEQLTKSRSSSYDAIVDAYIDTLFCSVKAYVSMLDLLRDSLMYAKSHTEKKDRGSLTALQSACKCSKYVLRFIIASRKLDVQNKEPIMSDAEFRSRLKTVMGLYGQMMPLKEPQLKGSKTYFLRAFSHLFEDLSQVYSEQELGEIACVFLESVPSGLGETMTIDKLKMIHQIVTGPCGQAEAARREVQPCIIRNLKQHLSEIRESKLTDTYMCVSILMELLNILQTNTEDPGTTVWEFHDLIPELTFAVLTIQEGNPKLGTDLVLEPPKEQVKKFTQVELLADSFLCLCTILHVMSNEQLDTFLAEMPFDQLQVFIPGILEVGINTVSRLSLFPELWIVMNIFELSTIIKVVQRVRTPISQKFRGKPEVIPLPMEGIRQRMGRMIILREKIAASTDENQYVHEVDETELQMFSTEMWQAMMSLCIEMTCVPTIQIQDFEDTRRQFVIEHYGDLRSTIVHEIREIWSALQEDKKNISLFLVPELVRLTRGGEESQSFARDAYFDLLTQEFKETSDFKDVESFTIDALYRTADVDREAAVTFVTTLVKIVGPKLAESQLATKGEELLDHIQDLFKIMCDLFDAPKTPVYEDDRTKMALDLMNYLDSQVQIRADMFFRFVQDLVDFHSILGNYVEAGVTQCMQIKRLKWIDDRVEALGSDYEASTERERREMLVLSAMDDFDRGEDWERAIEMCGLLKEYYRDVIYDYDKLSETLIKEADFCLKIMKNKRFFFPYYRVAFFGDFAERKDKEFIYRGAKLEPVRNFSKRIQDQFPQAKLVYLSTPRQKDLDAHPKVISITTLTLSSEQEMLGDAALGKEANRRITDEIAAYHKNNNVEVFTFEAIDQRGGDKPENEHKDLWVTQTFIRSEVSFPSTRRRADVVERHTVEITPPENAARLIEQKTKDLVKLFQDVQDAPPGPVDVGPLSQVLAGVIDAAVMGGTWKYVEAFLYPGYVEENPTFKEHVIAIKRALKNQQLELRHALDVFGRRKPPALDPLHEHLERTYITMMKKTEEFLVIEEKSSTQLPR